MSKQLFGWFVMTATLSAALEVAGAVNMEFSGPWMDRAGIVLTASAAVVLTPRLIGDKGLELLTNLLKGVMGFIELRLDWMLPGLANFAVRSDIKSTYSPKSVVKYLGSNLPGGPEQGLRKYISPAPGIGTSVIYQLTASLYSWVDGLHANADADATLSALSALGIALLLIGSVLQFVSTFRR